MSPEPFSADFPVVCAGGSTGDGWVDFVLSPEDIAQKIVELPNGNGK